MGHQRLGGIAKSRKWSAVVAAVAGEGAGVGGPGALSQSVAEIANLTLDAAQAGLERAIDDPGLRFGGSPRAGDGLKFGVRATGVRELTGRRAA